MVSNYMGGFPLSSLNFGKSVYTNPLDRLELFNRFVKQWKMSFSSTAIITWLISVHLTHLGMSSIVWESRSKTNFFLCRSNIAISINCDLEPTNNDGKLRKFLLCRYDKTVHPKLKFDPVKVSIEMSVKGFSFVS